MNTVPDRGDGGHTGRALERVRGLAWLLDHSIAIPGTRFRIGLDPLLGLIPGVGDAAGAILSSYILLEAGNLGVSRGTLLRMASNILLESLVGLVPLAGDLFDAGWKANQRNIRLLERSLADPGSARRHDRRFLAALVIGMGTAAIGLAAVSYLLLRFLLTLF